MIALDLCCGAGGMTRGMQEAGFEVVGVDVVARPEYPAALVQADLVRLAADDLPDAAWVHVSPPCQRFSYARPSRKRDPPTESDLDILKAGLRGSWNSPSRPRTDKAPTAPKRLWERPQAVLEGNDD